FREVLCNRDLRQSESNPNSPASGSRQVVLEFSKDGLIGDQHDDVLPRGPNEGPCPSDDIRETFHDVRDIDRGSPRRVTAGLQQGTAPSRPGAGRSHGPSLPPSRRPRERGYKNLSTT